MGSRATVHSWVWPENDRLPQVLYAKFENAAWRLDGIEEDGIYPIYPISRTWYLDKKDKKLGVKRCQLPVIPAFAMTAHCSQGKTLSAAIVDLDVDSRVDKSFGIVAASRVRKKEDMLILRSFPLWLYRRGAPEGPQLLLQKLRGDELDWEAMREARMPYAPCEKCRQIRTLDCFDHKNWELIRANRSATCKGCLENAKGPRKRALPTGAPKLVECRGCKRRKVEDAFPRAQLVQQEERGVGKVQVGFACLLLTLGLHFGHSPCSRTNSTSSEDA